MAKGKIKQFPHISRFFTANQWQFLRTIALGLVLTVFLFNIAFLAKAIWDKEQAKQNELRLLTSQKEQWEEIVAKYPDYRDAYFQLATVEYKLNNREEAKHYLEKALGIDPNFKPALDLKSLLGF